MKIIVSQPYLSLSVVLCCPVGRRTRCSLPDRLHRRITPKMGIEFWGRRRPQNVEAKYLWGREVLMNPPRKDQGIPMSRKADPASPQSSQWKGVAPIVPLERGCALGCDTKVLARGKVLRAVL